MSVVKFVKHSPALDILDCCLLAAYGGDLISITLVQGVCTYR